MVTFKGHHGYDGKAPLIDGFEVIKDERVVGFIYPSGHFLRLKITEGHDVDTPLNEEEFAAISDKGAQVRRMPSEYGWIGVGEPAIGGQEEVLPL